MPRFTTTQRGAEKKAHSGLERLAISSEPCDDKLPEYAAQLAISDALANLSFLIESSRKPLEQYSE